MRSILPDALGLAGFAAICLGLWLEFGRGWTLMIGGAILFGSGLVAAWRANRP
jgi:hypothetical protein